MKYDLLTLGEILLRLSPPDHARIMDGDTFVKQPGGAELNVASGCSLLGLHTGMISRLPGHGLGMFARNKIRSLSVGDEYLVYDDSADARLGIYYYESGAYPRKPGVIYDRRHSSICNMDIQELDECMFADTRCFHTCGITLALNEQVKNTAIQMIHKFKEQGSLISFDVNFRGNLWTEEEAKKTVEEILPYVDIFFCSEDTARMTFQKTGDIKSIMKSFTEEYPISVVATTQRVVHSAKSHTFGSILYSAKEDRYYEENPYHNIEVVDRIGSGDAFVGGVLYGLLKHEFDCQKAIEYGNATGAMKNTVPGDLPLWTLKEIDKIIENHKSTGKQTEMER